jgi:hypothetical protein
MCFSALAQHVAARSIELAHQTRHAMSIALALVTNLLTPLPGGLNLDASRAEEVVSFCAVHGLKNFEAWAGFAKGAIAARRGEPSNGIALMQAAMTAATAIGSRLFRPVQLAALAIAHAKIGEIEESDLPAGGGNPYR